MPPKKQTCRVDRLAAVCCIEAVAMSSLCAATEHFVACLEKAEADLKAVARRFEEEFQDRCAGVMVRLAAGFQPAGVKNHGLES